MEGRGERSSAFLDVDGKTPRLGGEYGGDGDGGAYLRVPVPARREHAGEASGPGLVELRSLPAMHHLPPGGRKGGGGRKEVGKPGCGRETRLPGGPKAHHTCFMKSSRVRPLKGTASRAICHSMMAQLGRAGRGRSEGEAGWGVAARRGSVRGCLASEQPLSAPDARTCTRPPSPCTAGARPLPAPCTAGSPCCPSTRTPRPAGAADGRTCTGRNRRVSTFRST